MQARQSTGIGPDRVTDLDRIVLLGPVRGRKTCTRPALANRVGTRAPETRSISIAASAARCTSNSSRIESRAGRRPPGLSASRDPARARRSAPPGKQPGLLGQRNRQPVQVSRPLAAGRDRARAAGCARSSDGSAVALAPRLRSARSGHGSARDRRHRPAPSASRRAGARRRGPAPPGPSGASGQARGVAGLRRQNHRAAGSRRPARTGAPIRRSAAGPCDAFFIGQFQHGQPATPSGCAPVYSNICRPHMRRKLVTEPPTQINTDG